MAAHGRIPKRASQRLGHRTKDEKAVTTTVSATGSVKVPPAVRDWHPLAKDWYRSLADSAQSQFFEPSDWATARVVAESLSRDLKPKVLGMGIDGPIVGSAPLNGASLTAYLKAMADLLTTEAARRRVQLEIIRKPLAAAPAPVVKMDDYRDL